MKRWRMKTKLLMFVRIHNYFNFMYKNLYNIKCESEWFDLNLKNNWKTIV